MRLYIRHTLCATLAIVLLSALPVQAQAPMTFLYQGRLTDNAADPITVETTVTFRLFAASSGGSALWSEQRTLTPDADGIFTIELGQSAALNSTVLNGSTRYLGITVSGSSEMTPRQLVVSVPYAISAYRAEQSDGVSDGAIDTDALADDAVSSAKIVDGTIQFRDLGQNSAILGQVPQWDGSQWIPAVLPIFGTGDITGVTAGTGLTGGGMAGDVTLNIAVGGVTNTQLGDDAVDADKILDGSIGFDDLGQNSATTGQVPQWNGSMWIPVNVDGGNGDITGVTAGAGLAGGGLAGDVTLQVAVDGIRAEHIQDNAIGSNKIQDGSVLGDDIADATVTGDHLVAGAVGSKHLGANSVSSVNIVDESITGLDIAPQTVGTADLNEWISLGTGASHGRLFLNATSSTAGYSQTTGPSGWANVVLGNLSTNENSGFLAIQDSSGQTRAAVFVSSNRQGFVDVRDNEGIPKAWMTVQANGQGLVSADVKNFIRPNPAAAGTDIWYACPEGPEAAAYVRGSGTLVNGYTQITLPGHFGSVATNINLTVILTPLSADSKGLAVVSKSVTGFEVRELFSGTGSYDFDYRVSAVRQGYENYEAIRPSSARAFGASVDRESNPE